MANADARLDATPAKGNKAYLTAIAIWPAPPHGVDWARICMDGEDVLRIRQSHA